MNQRELTDVLAAKLNVTRTSVENVILSLKEEIKIQLIRGNDVKIIGLGTFHALKHKPRKGRNPQTGELIKIPGMVRPKFRAGEALKTAVAKSKI